MEEREARTHIVIVLPPTRKVFFPFCLIKGTLGMVLERNFIDDHEAYLEWSLEICKVDELRKVNEGSGGDAPSGFSQTLSRVCVLNQ